MEDAEVLRIDKFLWFTRLFASRSNAIHACQSGRITIHGHAAKPSRIIQPGCTFDIIDDERVRTFRVTAIPSQRLPASNVGLFLECLGETPSQDRQDNIRHFSRSTHTWGVPSRRGLKIISSFLS
ncbi:MAG TPA: RNA-binding S4 domain-containing protein [Opitutales bacterium]|nr:RNA-binding S4 domain-containing protein [Opitutales bacterium]HOO92560.1 RNA-binding S4 domain-containing protein [Opitutales bacterium]